MKCLSLVVSAAAALSGGLAANAQVPSGKVIYVESYNVPDSASDWGVVMIKPDSGSWPVVWVKSSASEALGFRMLAAAGRATSEHVFAFYNVDQDPNYDFLFGTRADTLATITRLSAVSDATRSGSGNSIQVTGEISRMFLFADASTRVYVGSQWWRIDIDSASQHSQRLFTVALGGLDADHDVDFHNLSDLGFGSYAAWDGTSVNSYRARNQ